MKILVTGAGGFVGRHVVRELTQNSHEPLAFDLNFSSPVEEASDTFTGDLRDPATVNSIIDSAKPEACIHLGAISFVPAGKADPDLTLSVNIFGTVNLLEALRKFAPSSRILVISTAQIYGSTAQAQAIKEDAAIAPLSMYAVSKAAADLTSLAYARHYNLHAMTARPNNHTGPGQSPRFAIPSFARQIKSIAKEKAEPMLKVGNLESQRDFTDVRDVARSYRLLIEKGQAGEAYNISSQNNVKIGVVLQKLCDLAGVKPEIIVDPERFRPTDSSPFLDTTKLRKDTGWKPEIDLDQTLRDILSES